jgi:hypothetical protein
MKLKLKGRRFDSIEIQTELQNAMKTLTQNDFSSAPDHANPAGIAVSMPKGPTSKGMGANRSFGWWLSCGRGISWNFWVAPRTYPQLV